MARSCSIDDCPYPHEAKGFCNKHYRRWKVHGDPLIVGKRGGGGNVRLGFREPMDDWDKKRVTCLLEQGLSYRAIQRSTGICYMTVMRFKKKLRNGLA
jgi:hypothetical protein